MLLISKKDLLNETGISYGQLYRWKREGLIPEEWFIKKSSFTGQETFFPKEKIIKRIKTIQQLKERYSLEELAKILSPEISERNFTVEDLQIIEEIENGLIPCFCKVFEKNNFSYMEVLILIAISKCNKNFSLELKDIESICLGAKNHINNIKQANCVFALLNKKGEYFVSIYYEQSKVFFDNRWVVLCQIQLNEISSLMKLKYRKSFNLRLDDEEDSVTLVSDRMVTT